MNQPDYEVIQPDYAEYLVQLKPLYIKLEEALHKKGWEEADKLCSELNFVINEIWEIARRNRYKPICI